jgi:hypothetical protein
MRRRAAGVFCVLLAASTGCEDEGDSGGSLGFSAVASELSLAARVAQSVAGEFAPLLRFDQEQGDTNKGEYYEARKSGDPSRICNTSYESIQNAEVPVYYQYSVCSADLSVTTAPAGAQPGCVPLLAGRWLEVGSVCVGSADEQLSVTYSLDAGWEMTEAHLWVGESLEDVPGTRSGNPIPGHFEHRFESETRVPEHGFDVDVWGCGVPIHLAAHAEVRQTNQTGAREHEGAWGGGPWIVEQGSWATYFSVELSCTEVVMYWYFYGWQDTCSPGKGDHPADWERIAVKVVDAQLDRVIYFQHEGQYTREPGNYSVYEGTHPVVYVGKNSHGSYHDDGGSGTCCYYEDFRNPGNPDQHLKAWLNLERLSLDPGAPEWMRYSGTQYWDGLTGPLHRTQDADLCNLQGCRGAWTPVCHTNGCMKSDIGDDVF